MIFFIIRHEVWEIRLPKNRYQPSKKKFFYFFFWDETYGQYKNSDVRYFLK